MRAAVLHECPGWLDITDLHVGVIGPHEVLVQTQAAGLCHSDLHCIEGTLPIGVPVVLGHESAGVVEAVGSDVTDFRPGDAVIACTSMACGSCAMCSTGRPNMCQNPPTSLRRSRSGALRERHCRSTSSPGSEDSPSRCCSPSRRS